MSLQRRQYRPIPNRIPQGSDNSALYGAAALATLAAGGYLGYRHLTKDKKKPEALAAPVVPTQDERSRYEKYMGRHSLSDFLTRQGKVQKDGLGYVENRGFTSLDALGIGAGTLGLATVPALTYAIEKDLLSGKRYTSLGESLKEIGKSTGQRYLKNLKSPKVMLAAAIGTGMYHVGTGLKHDRFKGIRHSVLPNAGLNPDNYSVSTGRVLGSGLTAGATGGLLSVGYGLGTKPLPKSSTSVASLRDVPVLKQLLKNPKKAILASALLGMGGRYLGDSFTEVRR